MTPAQLADRRTDRAAAARTRQLRRPRIAPSRRCTATLAARRPASATSSPPSSPASAPATTARTRRSPASRPTSPTEQDLSRRSRRRRWRCSTSSSPRSAPRSARSKQALEASESRDTESRTADRRSRPPPEPGAGPARAGPVALPLRLLRPAARNPRRPRRRPRRRRPLRLPVRSAVRRRPGRRSRPKACTELAQARRAPSMQLETEIPPDVNWVLRIDGHTDKRPISNAAVPLQLGAVGRPAPSRSPSTWSSQGVSPNRAGRRRLRRIHARSIRATREEAYRAQPAHRVQADGGIVTPADPRCASAIASQGLADPHSGHEGRGRTSTSAERSAKARPEVRAARCAQPVASHAGTAACASSA